MTDARTDRLLGNRIRRAIRDAGTTQAEVARALNVSPQSVGQWVKNGLISRSNLYALSNLLDVSAHWLLTGEVDGGEAVMEAKAEYNIAPGPDIHRMVPEISWVQAGHWSEVVDNYHPGDGSQWVPTIKSTSQRAFALRVQGDSMTPRFPEGTILVVDPDREADNGAFVVARIDDDNEATFKQLVRDAGRCYLRPLNPQYPMIPVDEQVRIVGVVVQATQEV